MFKEIFEDILKDLGLGTTKRPQDLICPNCSSKMKKLLIKIRTGYSQENLQLDFCQECEGIWFDRGELVKALEIDIKDISKYFPSKTKQSFKGSGRRVCPVCQKQLSLINYSKDSNIWVDICSDGCGIYLDAGELELIKLYSINPTYITAAQKEQISESIPTPQISAPRPTTNQFSTEIRDIASKVDNLKNKILGKIKEMEEIIKTRDIRRLRTLIDKGIFFEEKQEIEKLYQEIRNMYQKYGTRREIEEIQLSLENIMKFVDIRTNSIKERISSELKNIEAETISYREKQIEQEKHTSSPLPTHENKPEIKVEPKSEPKKELKQEPKAELKTEPKIESKLEPKTEPIIDKTELKTEAQKVQETKLPQTFQEPKSEKQPKIEKIKLSGFENIYNHLIFNGNLYLFSENKIFKYKDNSFHEIKVKELNFRIKKVKLVSDKVYLLGSSGGIIELNVDMEFKNYYRMGYSDINDLLCTESKNLILSSNRVYFVDNNFKVIQEKSVSTNFLEEFQGNIIGGTTSLVVFDNELNKIKEYPTGSYQQIKKAKIVEGKLFLLGSGILMTFEADNIIKFNLPKSYLEINDIQKIDNTYYICSSSGGFYSTSDFKNYEEIKLNTFDNIYSIAYFNGKIYLGCSNSNVIVISW